MFCKYCNQEKEENDFSWKIKSKGAKANRCKSCQKVYKDKHYRDNADFYKGKAREIKRIIREENITYLSEYLKNHPCIDCGESDPVVLEFDHHSDKEFGIAEILSCGYALKYLVKEIEKCDIRCVNCHKRKTAKEQGWWRNEI
jgi:hypothetical protein